MEIARSRSKPEGLEPQPARDQPGVDKPPAWEMIETGRYRPRRIKGSLLGRELG
jgi:hypothetical protein